MTKTLFMVITDSGDGSNGIHYTFDSELIQLMDDNQDQLGDSYQSSDGLQVRRLQVPEECTYESLGIPKWSVLNRANYAFAQEPIKIVFVIDESGSMAAGATRGFTADAKGMEFAYLNASAATTAYRNGGL